MKGILDWMKAHLSVVALVLVILISIPSAFAVSTMLNGGLRKAREAEVNKDMSDLKADVTYVIPAVTPGGESVSVPAQAPNETMTKWFREQRQARDAQVGEVVKIASDINHEGHEFILDGLFPAPPEAESVFKRLEFVDLLTGKGEGPGVYQRLFDAVHAGAPADPVKVSEEVRDLEDREKERIRAEFGASDMTPDQRRKLDEKLVAQRLGRYQRRATEISVYATPECLDKQMMPRRAITNVEDEAALWQCFEWQWDYWIVGDLLNAIAEANTDEGGSWTPVDRSVVKRVEKIRIERLPFFDSRNVLEDDWTPTPGQGSDKAPLDPFYSITGRRTSKHNSMYDVRTADLELIVDSARVADLINAISRTNFMTVIGCELREADPWKDLELGYYYGTAHVVKAKLKVETVWLRSWTEPVMPDNVKFSLGIAATDAAAAAPAEAATAPAPAVRRAAPPDPEEGAARGRRRGGGDDGGGG